METRKLQFLLVLVFLMLWRNGWSKNSEIIANTTLKEKRAEPVFMDSNSVTYRSVLPPRDTHLTLLREDITTMERLVRYLARRFPTRRCLGTREILAEEDEKQKDGRLFKKYVLGNYRWKNYSEVDQLSNNFGVGLRVLKQEPRKNLVIFAETREEWMISAHACFKQNIPIVTIYSTLGDEAIAHGINETEVTMIITSHDLLPKFKKILYMCPLVNTIIYMRDQLKTTDSSGFKEGVNIVAFEDVVKMGDGAGGRITTVPPSPDDTVIIMYTSGSTGVPKGVILTHRNMIATLRAFSDCVDINEKDVFLGFLPLAHVFEQLVESSCMLHGVPIGYSTPLTMIDSSSKIKYGTKGDATVLSPTVMTAVPLILDRIYKGVYGKVSKKGGFSKALFEFACQYKAKWVRRGFDTPLLNRLVFRPIRGVLGGRIRYLLCGGAPLSPQTHDVIQNCLCASVLQGYGLTETTSCATIMDLHDRSLGRVGNPSTLSDVRLVDWDEGNYRVTDKPYPRGEIIVGGDNISPGYYKMPDKSKEDFFDEDGKRWFRTGDIGECHPDGAFNIIDRKKDLVKLQLGEYVSLGKVESQLKTCPLVENICVYGDPTKHHTVALVVPNQSQLTALGNTLGLSASFEDLCSNPAVEKAVLRELAEHAKKCKLEKFEVPLAVKLCTEVWSPDMGLVTAAFKLKRKDIQERYQHEINRMYAS